MSHILQYTIFNTSNSFSELHKQIVFKNELFEKFNSLLSDFLKLKFV
jgi:hypothetical protein